MRECKTRQLQLRINANQDLLLLSLYSLIPPLRGEVKTLKFAKTPQRAGDWVVIQSDGEVKLDLNEEKSDIWLLCSG